MYCGQIALSKIDAIRPLAIPVQISIITMYTPSLVKIHWYLLKLSGNENVDVSRADNSVSWQNLPINNAKPDFLNINAPTWLVKIYIHVLKLTSGNKNTDGRWTHWQPAWYHDTRHYRVAGIKMTFSMALNYKHWRGKKLFCHFWTLIVFGFNDTSALVCHFVSSPREREKMHRRDSRGDERE